MAQRPPNVELVVFERSGHMIFVEKNEKYLDRVREILNENRTT